MNDEARNHFLRFRPKTDGCVISNMLTMEEYNWVKANDHELSRSLMFNKVFFQGSVSALSKMLSEFHGLKCPWYVEHLDVNIGSHTVIFRVADRDALVMLKLTSETM